MFRCFGFFHLTSFRNLSEEAPLHCASENGHRGVCELLISRGAQINASGKEYCSLRVSLCFEHTWVSDETCFVLFHLISFRAPSACTPLHRSSENGHRDVCELLISRGAQIDANDSG
jgi:ankyrin repeat protein